MHHGKSGQDLLDLLRSCGLVKNVWAQGNPLSVLAPLPVQRLAFELDHITVGDPYMNLYSCSLPGHRDNQRAVRKGAKLILCEMAPQETIRVPVIEIERSLTALS